MTTVNIHTKKVWIKTVVYFENSTALIQVNVMTAGDKPNQSKSLYCVKDKAKRFKQAIKQAVKYSKSQKWNIQ